MTSDIRVSAYYSNDYVRVINDVNSGFSTASYIDGKDDVIIYIWVTGSVGNYSITYSNENARPHVLWPEGLNDGAIDITTSPSPGLWLDGTITAANIEHWYILNGEPETRYYIWWNDSYQGNNTMTSDIRVCAYYSDDYVRVINDINSGFTTASYIDGKDGVTVYIRVNGGVGTYSLTYTKVNTRPIVPWPSELPVSPIDITSQRGTWIDGNIPSGGSTVWYSLNVEFGTRYYIWWNDSYQGNATKTVDIYVSGYFSNDYVRVINDINSGWTTPQYIDGKDGVTVYILVRGNIATAIGTYGIAYDTTNTRPIVP